MTESSKTVQFRAFEERDADFIFKCKNDEKLNRMIVGQYRRYTHEEAEAWVAGEQIRQFVTVQDILDFMG